MRIIKTLITLGMVFLMSVPTSFAQQSNQDNPYNRAPNHLEGVASPYLQQHIYNAVDWYPWGQEALQKARDDNKPIFLSIGYSTCHWCHVMAHESFDNDGIGAFLNENFISIKVDRERRPDLDEQFMLVTQVVSGNGGWPNSLFLTKEGEPFYAGTYFPPEQFLDLLHQINGLWQEQPDAVKAEGLRIGDVVRTYMTRSAAAQALTPEAISGAADILLRSIDPTNGGIGSAPKFPREANMLFLLDQAERRASSELLTVVTNALDGMIKGGIHDQIGGGFHRYATDAEWQIPHFEKMLYNQALIGRMLVRAYSATNEYRYKRAAVRTFDYVIREMQDSGGGFYSAQDADSLGANGELEEGPFYIWTPREIAALAGSDTDFTLTNLSITSRGNFEGSNIPHLNTFPSEDEVAFYGRLDDVMDVLRASRLTRPAPHQDQKIVVDWNASMIETLAEASHVFDRPDYYQAAQDAASFITQNMLSEDGLARVSFEGATGVVAQLSDYAGLGNAFLALYDYAANTTETHADKALYLERAQKLASQIHEHFANEEDTNAPFRMTAIPEGLGIYIPLDDSELPAGNALTLALFNGLAKRTGDPTYAQQATLLAAALSGHALSSPASRAATLTIASALSHGEVGPVRYVANGKVKVIANIDHSNGLATLNIEIAQGWHINANVPLEDYLIPTQLSVSGTQNALDTYPAPIVKSLGFNSEPLALYEQQVQLFAQLSNLENNDPGQILLELQACSDEICLAPEEVIFTLW